MESVPKMSIRRAIDEGLFHVDGEDMDDEE
jgi:hypothetical protein